MPMPNDAPAPAARTPRPPLTAAQQTLAARFAPLAAALAKSYRQRWPREYDLFSSAAATGLVEAAQTFDPARNVRFGTFARYRIRGRLKDAQRELVTRGYHADPDAAPPVGSLPFDAEEQGRVIGCEPDMPVGWDLEQSEWIESRLEKLPPPHARLCRVMFLENRTQGEAGAIVGKSRSRVSQLLKEALELLKSDLELDARLAGTTLQAEALYNDAARYDRGDQSKALRKHAAGRHGV